MITTFPMPNGYTFNLHDEMLAVGTYNDTGFNLLETDGTITTHANGMLALSYLRTKHTPEFYTVPVKKKFITRSKPQHQEVAL